MSYHSDKDVPTELSKVRKNGQGPPDFSLRWFPKLSENCSTYRNNGVKFFGTSNASLFRQIQSIEVTGPGGGRYHDGSKRVSPERRLCSDGKHPAQRNDCRREGRLLEYDPVNGFFKGLLIMLPCSILLWVIAIWGVRSLIY